jgi:hypothetical protein
MYYVLRNEQANEHAKNMSFPFQVWSVLGIALIGQIKGGSFLHFFNLLVLDIPGDNHKFPV